MIFEIKEKKDKKLEELYEETMRELEEFFDMGWSINRPNLYIVSDRKTIDGLRSEKSSRWVTGWGGARLRAVYILDSENFEKESDHTYTPEKWRALVKHEMTHCFFDVLTGFTRKPIWLNEGVSLYVAGQIKWHKKVEKFGKFLDFYSDGGAGVYDEAGRAIELLVEKYGREKLLQLMRRMKEERPEDEKMFAKLFKEVYGFELGYEGFNEMLE